MADLTEHADGTTWRYDPNWGHPFKYQFGAIETAAGDINSTSGRITQMLGDLKSQIQPMTATWEGESAAAYAAAQAKWDNAAAELNTILATISRTVSQGNERMGDVNRMAAASWG